MSLTRQAVELPPYRATSHHLVLELAANSTVGLGEIEISDCSSQSFLRSLKTTTTTTTTTSTTSTTTPDFVTTDSYLDSLDDFTVNLREALVTTAFPEPALPTDWSIDDNTLQFFTSANVATQGESIVRQVGLGKLFSKVPQKCCHICHAQEIISITASLVGTST